MPPGNLRTLETQRGYKEVFRGAQKETTEMKLVNIITNLQRHHHKIVILWIMNRQTEVFHVTLMLYFHKVTSSNILNMVAISSFVEFTLDTLNGWFFQFA